MFARACASLTLVVFLSCGARSPLAELDGGGAQLGDGAPVGIATPAGGAPQVGSTPPAGTDPIPQTPDPDPHATSSFADSTQGTLLVDGETFVFAYSDKMLGTSEPRRWFVARLDANGDYVSDPVQVLSPAFYDPALARTREDILLFFSRRDADGEIRAYYLRLDPETFDVRDEVSIGGPFCGGSRLARISDTTLARMGTAVSGGPAILLLADVETGTQRIELPFSPANCGGSLAWSEVRNELGVAFWDGDDVRFLRLTPAGELVVDSERRIDAEAVGIEVVATPTGWLLSIRYIDSDQPSLLTELDSNGDIITTQELGNLELRSAIDMRSDGTLAMLVSQEDGVALGESAPVLPLSLNETPIGMFSRGQAFDSVFPGESALLLSAQDDSGRYEILFAIAGNRTVRRIPFQLTPD